MKAKFLGFVASLVLLGAAPVQATTIYEFDTPVSGNIVPAGSVALSVNGLAATFTVSLPASYSFTELAFNLSGGTVATSGAYTITNNANAYFQKDAFSPKYGPFNTELDATGGGFGNSLTFTVSNFAGLDFKTIAGMPIWFVASFVYNGGTSGVIAADYVMPQTTPLPAALPLFAGGLGALGLLRLRRRKSAAPRLAA